MDGKSPSCALQAFFYFDSLCGREGHNYRSETTLGARVVGDVSLTSATVASLTGSLVGRTFTSGTKRVRGSGILEHGQNFLALL